MRSPKRISLIYDSSCLSQKDQPLSLSAFPSRDPSKLKEQAASFCALVPAVRSVILGLIRSLPSG